MKKYRCIKEVLAEPMTRFEAQELNLVRDETDVDEEGYLVKYSEEYSSWTPKEPFEKGYLEIKKAIHA